ncbi:related to PET56-rRNA (guanosine-2`-O-)-methyltransferase [Fusarium oxysporum]|uniref:rRNA methyltransferase 1, mitochondrial n=2 Tax=Fusarium oxysporum TaxID=5507 RepID=N4TGC1_FUSC1|nr:rRNA methyltransferase 1, mitochondrial [Fusarium oxysporum f. sp. cubense race 1]SCO77832.1 related to PET56-rRNA (guanosine-2`-O-)-methyltransferase [Fusarium oxysporum]
MLIPTQLRVAALNSPLARLHPATRGFAPIFVRAKGLSAIIRGAIRSERVQNGPDSFDARNAYHDTGRRKVGGGRLTRPKEPPHRDRDDFFAKFSARATDSSGTRNWRQEQKLKKKLRKKEEEKKEREEREELGIGRRTRRKRFADPENEFGNRSFVHRMKYGDLKEVADNLNVKQPVRPRSFPEAQKERTFGSRDGDNDVARHERHEPSNEKFEKLNQQFNRSIRRPEDPQQRFGRFDRQDRQSNISGRSSNGEFDGSQRRFDRSQPSDFRHDNARQDRQNDQGDDSVDIKRGKKKEMMAMTLKYTTAASQFLYGRSVVKAALEQNRRKLYNLYIHANENRKYNTDTVTLTRMAKKLNVPIKIVPPEEQRIMDKMSMGRPHNGFVLEASPLPQIPIKSLGNLEESPGRLGFHVDLDHQTKEEATINGTDTFIRRSNDVMPKPFVLLLNEIVDPGNLGGIIRTASYLGVDAVGITNRGSSTLTPVVLKSAAGAVEEVSLFAVDDPVKFIQDSQKAGWKSYAAVAPPDRKLVRKHGSKFVSTDTIEAQSPLNEHPCLLILGNEGYGLSKPIKVAADYELSVPRFVQGSCVDSLNVSVAAGLLCHSFVKEPVTVAPQPVEPTARLADSVASSDDAESRTIATKTGAKLIEAESDNSSEVKTTGEESEVDAVTEAEQKHPDDQKLNESDDLVF